MPVTPVLATKAPIAIWRGNSRSLIWQINLDWTGSEAVLTIFDETRSSLLLTRRSSDGGLVLDFARRRVSWQYTTAESRSIPNNAQYEIERRIDGSQATLVCGPILVKGGANIDV